MPEMGTINVHGSLLPQYRGAAPINWAIINGEKHTGVTTFKLQHEIDTGDILLQQIIPIGENETAGEIHDRMKEIGAALLVKTIEELADGRLKEKPQVKTEDQRIQDTPALKHAPKIFTETCRIDWNQTLEAVHNLIRGLSPFPGAFTFLDQKMLKIYRGEKLSNSTNVQPGKYQTDGKTYLRFACADGFFNIKELQLEGKKRMNVEDFLRGYKFAETQSDN
jgi:methionyl-tRNA formyltransferase